MGFSIPRILRIYDKACFTFTDNFLRMSFPFDKNLVYTEHDTEHDKCMVNNKLTSCAPQVTPPKLNVLS